MNLRSLRSLVMTSMATWLACPLCLQTGKKGHFMKGDAVIVIKGDLKNLEGWVEKVEDETVHIRPKISDLSVTNCNYN
jgi:hypothetical protein